jgi:hypothetical protein
MVLFGVPWYLTAIFALIAAVVVSALFLRKNSRAKEINILQKKIRKIMRKAKKKGDAFFIYETLENELLPAIRNELPRRIYKYYRLSDDTKSNERRLEAIKNNTIWASTYSEFNDPFECQYFYLNESDLLEMGIPNPENAKKLWDSIMEQIRKRITIMCFTQNPNDMPMWAHYANEHKGFCVEYEVEKYNNLYPVFYSKNRMKGQALFVELVYDFFNKESEGKGLSSLFKYLMLTSAFKDKSWESEHEIRAIFMNSLDDMTPKGRLFDCKTIGIRPAKIFIGAKCISEHADELIRLSEELNMTYEKCMLSSNESFRVISEENLSSDLAK